MGLDYWVVLFIGRRCTDMEANLAFELIQEKVNRDDFSFDYCNFETDPTAAYLAIGGCAVAIYSTVLDKKAILDGPISCCAPNFFLC